MKGCLHFSCIALSLLGSFVSSNVEVQTNYGHLNIRRTLSSSTTTLNQTSTVPTAAPSIHVQITLSPSPSPPTESAFSPRSVSLTTTASNSMSIPDSTQQQVEKSSGIFGMNLFQTCAVVILVATIVGVVGHFGIKLSRPNHDREDSSRSEWQADDSIASFGTLTRTSVTSVGV